MPRTSSVTPGQVNKLIASLKKNPGQSERFYVEATGIPPGSLGSVLFKAEVEADPTLAIKPTPAGITAAVNKGDLRWPRIAAYAGISIAQAKALYRQHTGKEAPSSMTVRGRKSTDGATAKKAAPGKKAAPAKKAEKAAKPAGTSGRRQAAGKKAETKPASDPKAGPRGRRGTRASVDPK